MDNLLKFQISILCLPSRSGHSCQPHLVLLWPRVLCYQMGKVGERKSVDCLHNLTGFCVSDRGKMGTGGKLMHFWMISIFQFQITDILNIAFATANEKPPSRYINISFVYFDPSASNNISVLMIQDQQHSQLIIFHWDLTLLKVTPLFLRMPPRCRIIRHIMQDFNKMH